MGTVAIGIGIGTCIGIGVSSVETLLHITFKAIFIRVGLGVGLGIRVGQWKHTITWLQKKIIGGSLESL